MSDTYIAVKLFGATEDRWKITEQGIRAQYK